MSVTNQGELRLFDFKNGLLLQVTQFKTAGKEIPFIIAMTARDNILIAVTLREVYRFDLVNRNEIMKQKLDTLELGRVVLLKEGKGEGKGQKQEINYSALMNK